MLFCGSQSEGKNHSATLHLHGDYTDKPGQKPKKTLELAKAKIDSGSASPPGSHSNSPYNTMSMSPYTGSPPFGTSPSYASTGVQQYVFQVVLPNETNEFKAESEDDRLKWIKLLGLLIMFPHSVIPEEPASSPIKESFRVKLDPKFYHAGESVAFGACLCSMASYTPTHAHPHSVQSNLTTGAEHWQPLAVWLVGGLGCVIPPACFTPLCMATFLPTFNSSH